MNTEKNNNPFLAKVRMKEIEEIFNDREIIWKRMRMMLAIALATLIFGLFSFVFYSLNFSTVVLSCSLLFLVGFQLYSTKFEKENHQLAKEYAQLYQKCYNAKNNQGIVKNGQTKNPSSSESGKSKGHLNLICGDKTLQ